MMKEERKAKACSIQNLVLSREGEQVLGPGLREVKELTTTPGC